MLKAVFVSIFCLAATTPAFAAKGKPKSEKATTKKEAKADKKDVKSDGLVIEDEKVGSGKEAKLGSKITVHYRGTFPDGRELDSSYKRGQPTSFPLNRVIPCWTEAVQMMKVGGKARITCPPQLAYGERGAGGVIPPNATLHFEIELIAIR